MKVRFLGVQRFTPETGSVSHKVFYSTDNSQVNTPLDMDDVKASLTYHGEKMKDIKCTPEAYSALSTSKPASVIDLILEPNPTNPRFNICTGLNA